MGKPLAGQSPFMAGPFLGEVFPPVGGCQMDGERALRERVLSMWSSLVVGVGELLVGDEGTEKAGREEGEGEESGRGGIKQMFRVTDGERTCT